MKRVKLTESDLVRLVKRVIKEEEEGNTMGGDVKKFIKTITDDKGSWHIDRNTKTLYLTGKGWSYEMYCE